MKYTFKCKNKNYVFNGNTLQLFIGEDLTQIEDKNIKEYKEDELSIVTIYVTNACNARCQYCYENHSEEFMNEKSADNIIKYLYARYKVINKVRFFGGEPFLNFKIIKYIVEKLKKKIVVEEFSVTTNAVLITDYILEFLEQYNFKIIISLDGPDVIHDKLRIGCEHKSVVEKIKKIQKKSIGQLLEINCTYTKYHMEHISLCDLERYFEELEVKYIISDVITEKEFLKLPEENIVQDKKDSIDRCYKRLLTKSLNIGRNFYVSTIINAIVTHEYSYYFCEELCEGIAFDTDGERYPCTRLIRKCNFADSKLQIYNYKGDSKCKNCWARGICSFCTADIYLRKKIPYESAECEMKKMYEYALKRFCEYFSEDPLKAQQIVDNFYS